MLVPGGFVGSGECVGAGVGLAVVGGCVAPGDALGSGECVGPGVGLAVVGGCDGSDEGEVVGWCVGSGECDGAGVGSGECDGCAVGDVVGRGVSNGVTTPTWTTALEPRSPIPTITQRPGPTGVTVNVGLVPLVFTMPVQSPCSVNAPVKPC